MTQARINSAIFDAILAAPLTGRQTKILLALLRRGADTRAIPISAADLGDATALDRANARSTLRALQQKGLIAIEESRPNRIKITMNEGKLPSSSGEGVAGSRSTHEVKMTPSTYPHEVKMTPSRARDEGKMTPSRARDEGKMTPSAPAGIKSARVELFINKQKITYHPVVTDSNYGDMGGTEYDADASTRSGNVVGHPAAQRHTGNVTETDLDWDQRLQSAWHVAKTLIDLRGFKFHVAQTAKTMQMYAEWVRRGATIGDLIAAMLAAEIRLGKVPDSPVYYRGFMETHLNAKAGGAYAAHKKPTSAAERVRLANPLPGDEPARPEPRIITGERIE